MLLKKDAEIFRGHMEFLPQLFQRKFFFIVCLYIEGDFKEQVHLGRIFLLLIGYQIVLIQTGIEMEQVGLDGKPVSIVAAIIIINLLKSSVYLLGNRWR